MEFTEVGDLTVLQMGGALLCACVRECYIVPYETSSVFSMGSEMHSTLPCRFNLVFSSAWMALGVLVNVPEEK